MKTKNLLKSVATLSLMTCINCFAGQPVEASGNISSSNNISSPNNVSKSNNSLSSGQNVSSVIEVYRKEEIAFIVQKNSLIGKKFTEKCNNNHNDNNHKKDNTACLEDIKLIFSKKPLTFRVIEPNMMVTMDFSTSRLNINLNQEGKITSIEIG